jgi:serine phosphatase RsbU (regulator of sigma subunit)
LKYSDIYIDNRDKTKSIESSEIALKKSLQYEFEKEALKDSLEFEKEKEVQDVQIKEQETQAYVLYIGIAFMVLLFLIGIRSYQRKKKDNKKIQEQKKEVENQKIEIENQHIALAQTHQEISDSISYAKRIQEAILPPSSTLERHLKNGFVFYQPKDVVSGDFYWLAEHNSRVILAAADCTGHGVPGAMVSVVCHNALNRVLREFNIDQPAKILDQTRKIIIETFEASSENVKDGMDISLCSWDASKNELQWAGANNPLYIIRADNPSEIEIIDPDKQPIGKFEKAFPFTNHSIQLNKGDSYYLFTDGYMDQFGGEKGKKYKYSKFRNFLISSLNQNMDAQGKLIEEEFNRWKGGYEQLDDVCVIGVQV